MRTFSIRCSTNSTPEDNSLAASSSGSDNIADVMSDDLNEKLLRYGARQENLRSKQNQNKVYRNGLITRRHQNIWSRLYIERTKPWLRLKTLKAQIVTSMRRHKYEVTCITRHVSSRKWDLNEGWSFQKQGFMVGVCAPKRGCGSRLVAGQPNTAAFH